MMSGSRHLVDTCTWLIVAHRHALTSDHSAERLNLCLSGKELSSMFHLSLFPVTRAWRSRVGVGLFLWNRVTMATSDERLEQLAVTAAGRDCEER